MCVCVAFVWKGFSAAAPAAQKIMPAFACCQCPGNQFPSVCERENRDGGVVVVEATRMELFDKGTCLVFATRFRPVPVPPVLVNTRPCDCAVYVCIGRKSPFSVELSRTKRENNTFASVSSEAGSFLRQPGKCGAPLR